MGEGVTQKISNFCLQKTVSEEEPNAMNSAVNINNFVS